MNLFKFAGFLHCGNMHVPTFTTVLHNGVKIWHIIVVPWLKHGWTWTSEKRSTPLRVLKLFFEWYFSFRTTHSAVFGISVELLRSTFYNVKKKKNSFPGTARPNMPRSPPAEPQQKHILSPFTKLRVTPPDQVFALSITFWAKINSALQKLEGTTLIDAVIVCFWLWNFLSIV